MKTPDRVFIVGEVGSNYDGDLAKALAYVRALKGAGADAVKFQTIRKDRLVSPRILEDGRVCDNPVFQKLANLDIPEPWHHTLKETADREGIEFFSTPFYLEAIPLLESVHVRTYKVASGDITFWPLLEAIARTGKRVILSTGASTLRDVERALDVLVKHGARDITLLHCVSNYPPEWGEMNLRAIVTMREAFGLPVGISDHSPGSLVPIAAVALGATVIEKHVTFDRSLPGPDHPFAMTIDEFAEMARQVRVLEKALGTGDKAPSPAELAKLHRIRRGLYAPVTFEPTDDLNGIWLRPEHGRPPIGR